MTETKPVWAGFWARLGGFVADSIFLGIVGYGFGFLAFDALASLGSAARLIGAVVAIAYFGLLSSGPGGSRTLGMRLAKTKVVTVGGAPLGVARSFGRAAVLVLPMMLNGLSLDFRNPILDGAFGAIAVTLVFGISLAQVYLLIFNRPRRLVHDLVFGTVVVREDAIPAKTHGSPRHAAVAAIIVGLFLVLGIASSTGLVASLIPTGLQRTLAGLEAPRQAVQALPEVIEAAVGRNTTTFYAAGGPARVNTALIVTARLRSWPKDPKAEIARIGATVTRAYRSPLGESMRIVLIYGFDIGIASGSRSYTDTLDPSSDQAPKAPMGPTNPGRPSAGPRPGARTTG